MAENEKVHVRLPKRFAAQEAICARATRYNVIAGGQDAGKSVLALDALLSSKYGALNGFPVAMVVPDEDALVHAKRRVMNQIAPVVVGRLDRSRIELASGGSISFYAADKEGQIWDQYALVVMDDCTRMENFAAMWEDVLQPLLSKYRGHAWFFAKPAGVRGPFARLFMKSDRDPNWSSFVLSAADNPHIDQAALEVERETMDELVFAQERLGLLVECPIDLTAAQSIIGKAERFSEWCDRLAQDGLMVDGHPFTLDNRPAMRFIYDLIPATLAEGFARTDVIMKCTQVGFTVLEMLAMIYLALKFAPAKIGMFMPSQMLAVGKSSERFMPIVRTVPAVYKMMTGQKASGGRGDEGNVMIRNLGPSRFHFLWTSGKTATESFPMDVISFDEVQEMVIADMEKTKERLSASMFKYTLMGSTANVLDMDIHWWFKKGTQHQFHTECPHCQTEQILDEHFPQCIGYDPTYPRRIQREGSDVAPPIGEYRYRCHSCEGWIDDPQRGRWVAKNPEADIRSVHFPQMLSPTVSPREIIEAYYNADDLKNFYNRKLGKPFTDPTQVPVNLEMLNDCARIGMALGVEWKTRAKGTFMGIDQMGAFNVATIAERLPSGHMALIHAEEIYDDDPFARCDELMAQFGVAVCVVETLPNYNDAKRFAGRHLGKVFLAGYGNMDGEMLVWGDAVPTKADRKTDEADRDRYTVRIDQYKCMQVAMARIAKRVTVFPDPMALLQEVYEKGIKGDKKLVPLLKERVFFHFTRTALVADKDPEERKYRRRVVKVGIDPHFSYAYMLMNVAWARAHGTSSFIFSGSEDLAPKDDGDAVAVSPMLEQIRQEAARDADRPTCGGCEHFREDGYCKEHLFRVQATDPECPSYWPVSD